jgi:peroxiredoxin
VSASLLLFAVVLPWLIVALFVAVGAWIGFQLIQQNGRLLSRLESVEQRLGQLIMAPAAAPAVPAPAPVPSPLAPSGLPLGFLAPAFELPDLMGGRRSLTDFRGSRLLLIFFNPACGFCTRMAPAIAALSVDGRDGTPIPLVITTSDVEENRRLVAEHQMHCPVLLQEQSDVASQYECHGTPMGYLIDEQGRIASEQAVGADALLALIDAPPAILDSSGALGGKRMLAESKIQRDGLAAGTPAPAFTLPRLEGGELSLEQLRGQKVLLVFSDPNCGPCEALMPELERRHRAAAPAQVLMVSRGEVEANQAKVAQHGLTYPIVLQKQWEISRLYAMFATPVAYLIDEKGIIAADVATGAEPILALLDRAATVQAPDRPCPCGKPQAECGSGKRKARPAAGRRNGR